MKMTSKVSPKKPEKEAFNTFVKKSLLNLECMGMSLGLIPHHKLTKYSTNKLSLHIATTLSN